MQNINGKLVQSCWSSIKEQTSDSFFIETFYKTLFERYPNTRALFSDSIDTLKIELLTKLDNVINGIEHIKDIEPALVTLGTIHKNAGVSREMFDAFIEVMTEAAAIASNNTLNKTELNEWNKAFREISQSLLKAY